MEPQSPSIRACKRIFEKGSIYFVTNESLSQVDCKLIFNETLPLYICDPKQETLYKPSSLVQVNNTTSLPVSFRFGGSLVFIFTDEVYPSIAEPVNYQVELKLINDGWKYCTRRTYTIGKHEFEVNGNVAASCLPIKLGDWQSLLGTAFSGDVQYLVEFDCSDDVASRGAVLDLGDVKYCCTVELNDKALGRAAWQPYAFPIAGMLKAGSNILKITVTNTMANQFIANKGLEKWSISKIGPYHLVSLEFEAESLTSGLFGPVTIKGK
ncbi:MAG: hypothetical protein A2Y12_16110 [Planctomycetes bacterium GWF2_42_9]|nr:MAG: hypothetical protein A2Y12_16110 [Planctomycetes bacterium GWF2_42_9]